MCSSDLRRSGTCTFVRCLSLCSYLMGVVSAQQIAAAKPQIPRFPQRCRARFDAAACVVGARTIAYSFGPQASCSRSRSTHGRRVCGCPRRTAMVSVCWRQLRMRPLRLIHAAALLVCPHAGNPLQFDIIGRVEHLVRRLSTPLESHRCRVCMRAYDALHCAGARSRADAAAGRRQRPCVGSQRRAGAVPRSVSVSYLPCAARALLHDAAD